MLRVLSTYILFLILLDVFYLVFIFFINVLEWTTSFPTNTTLLVCILGDLLCTYITHILILYQLLHFIIYHRHFIFYTLIYLFLYYFHLCIHFLLPFIPIHLKSSISFHHVFHHSVLFLDLLYLNHFHFTFYGICSIFVFLYCLLQGEFYFYHFPYLLI